MRSAGAGGTTAHINPAVTAGRYRGPAPTHARTRGPALVSGQWNGWWIHRVGPLVGMFLAILCFSFLAKRIEVAKLYHFETANDRLARRAG